MNQLKPMIIVLLMLTSSLAGCAGNDTTDLEQQIADLQQSNDEMNETINQQSQDNAGLQQLTYKFN
jgi:outer membrane lipoprotein-sorting protein